ncbi:hypothetical protein B0H17DRAFT_1094862 [Mycena rosella]|uniref:Uncharacterized protein n=1 Tax=Mycena rosella TaxID=1033263 RepID=A0AAD7CSA9_MYCRO|nr:hypothetical protein B0H17DRAFT_1094862 [Mycena rosella]
MIEDRWNGGGCLARSKPPAPRPSCQNPSGGGFGVRWRGAERAADRKETDPSLTHPA